MAEIQDISHCISAATWNGHKPKKIPSVNRRVWLTALSVLVYTGAVVLPNGAARSTPSHPASHFIVIQSLNWIYKLLMWTKQSISSVPSARLKCTNIAVQRDGNHSWTCLQCGCYVLLLLSAWMMQIMESPASLQDCFYKWSAYTGGTTLSTTKGNVWKIYGHWPNHTITVVQGLSAQTDWGGTNFWIL